MVGERCIRIAFAFVLMAVIHSCTKDAAPDSALLDNNYRDVLSASSEPHLSLEKTKTALAGTDVVWSESDRISVLSDGANDPFILSSDAGKSSGNFSGNLTKASNYFALYPYSSQAEYDAGKKEIRFVIPGKQTYAESSFGNGANIAVAPFSDPSSELRFRNVCGMFTLSLTGTGTVRNIVLTDAGGAALWGTCSLTADDKIGTDNQTIAISGGSSSLTLDCGSGVALSSSAKEFRFIVPAGRLASGFKARVNFSNGGFQVVSTTKANVVNRSKVRKMPERTVNGEIVYNVENPAVTTYLDYVESHPYPNGNYDKSYIGESHSGITFTSDKSNPRDVPTPAHVSWYKSGKASSQQVRVSENYDLSGAYSTSSVTSSAESFDVYNLIPGRTYYCCVTETLSDRSVDTLVLNVLKPEGRRRYLKLEGVYNVRDLGGMTAFGGKKRLKYGQLFRGGAFKCSCKDGAKITEAGKQAALDAGLGAEFSMDKSSEGAMTESLVGPSLDHFQRDFSYSNISTTYTTSDTNMVFAVKWIINEARKGRSTYFHCHIGADRTGFLATVLEGLLGVPELELSEDFELTSFSYHPGKRYRYAELKKTIAAISKIDVSKNYNGPTDEGYATINRQFYQYLINGIKAKDGKTAKVPKEDLDWYINYMLEDNN